MAENMAVATIDIDDVSMECEVSYHSNDLVEEAAPHSTSIWRKLGPVDKDRLFYKILKATDLPILSLRWINSYKLNEDKAIRILLQLFVDLSSYQSVNLKHFLQHNDLDGIVPHMERTQNSVLVETGKYFLFVRNKSFLAKHAKIEEFLIILILKCAKQHVLNTMLKPVAKFVTEMANSQFRAIRHTGVYIGLKIQSALIDLICQYSAKIHNNSETLTKTTDPTQGMQLEQKLIRYKEHYEQLTFNLRFINVNIFEKNLNFADAKLYLMRADCVGELKKWIDIFPERFCNRNYINLIATATKDSHKHVRMQAIDLLIEVIEKHYEAIADFAPKYVATFTDRFNDIDYKVAVHAVDAITKFCKKIPVSSAIREAVMPHIYSNNFDFAAACGRFFAAQFQKLADRCNDEIQFGLCVLKKICKFEQNNKNEEFCLPYLIETLYDAMPVLQNVSIYLEFLKTPDLSDFSAEISLKILTEIVCIGYTGSCTWTRKTPRKQKVWISQKRQLTAEMISVLPKLMDKYTLQQLHVLVTIINRYKVYNVPGELDA